MGEVRPSTIMDQNINLHIYGVVEWRCGKLTLPIFFVLLLVSVGGTINESTYIVLVVPMPSSLCFL